MTSITDMFFMMKYNFYEDNIPQYAKLIYITAINDQWLVEDVITKNRAWVAKYDIYPLNNLSYYNYWDYSKEYEDIAIIKKLK
jgi:hypothetical protein